MFAFFVGPEWQVEFLANMLHARRSQQRESCWLEI